MNEEKPTRKNTRKIGNWGESRAREFLQARGFEVLDQNVYTEYGEIDLVARKDDRLHFVEVKTRQTGSYGHPEEAITPRKLQHMIESAQGYLQSYPDRETDYQIDVVAIQVDPQGNQDIWLFENVQ
jgi:putative endonuclease